MDSQTNWLLSLQQILGELSALDRRLQAHPESVTNAELLEAAAKVEKLKPVGTGARSGPYDIFYRKYSALLHPHLEARGLGTGTPAPPAWDFGNAMKKLESHFNDSESRLEKVTFVHDLMRAMQQLEAGGNVSDVEVQRLLDGMDEHADRVIDLAPEHLKLPGQFVDLRERLYQAVRRRASGYGPVNPGANSPVLSALQQAERVVRQLESGDRVDPKIIDQLLAEMKDLVNAVLEVAADDPDISARFARARKTLREHSITRTQQPAAFRFQGLVDLANSEDRLRREQDRLASEAWTSLTADNREGAATKLGEALDFLDRRRRLVGDERQQIFFAKEGKYLLARFLNEYLRWQNWGAALELVERAKSRALLI